MRTFVFFYYANKRPVLGSFGYMPLDGRLGQFRRTEEAKRVCLQCGYAGYEIVRAESLRSAINNPNSVTYVQELDK